MTRAIRVWRPAFVAAVIGLLVMACSGQPRQTSPPPVTAAPVDFVNRVWRVASSSSGSETGVLYVFLSDGTLVISSPHGTPAFGTWKRDGEGLTMIEEGLSYKANVLKLAADEFRIMINNPGRAVEIAFAPADQPAADSPAPNGSKPDRK